MASRYTIFFAISATIIVGWVDYLTGTEIRVFPLYFFPIAYAAWFGNKQLTIFTSILSTVLWFAALYFGGRHYSKDYIWVINFFTQGSGFVIIALILSKLHQSLSNEKSMSRRDALTGLANGRAFYEIGSNTLALCSRKERSITLAYIDLDNFKQANDMMGHQFGDDLLRKAAEIFKLNLRKSDIAARLGGDEFVILLPETTVSDAHTVLEKIRKNLELLPDFQKCSVTASIGAVSYAKAPSVMESVIKAADIQMYEVKKSSKNQVRVMQVMN